VRHGSKPWTLAAIFMSFRKSSAVLLIPLLFSCNDKNIVGTWRPADLPKYPSHGSSYNDSLGDLVISSDSTFLFKGVRVFDTLSGFFGGGGSFKGTWSKPDKTHLILLPEKIDKKFSEGFTFTIFALDKQKLIIHATLSPDTMKPRTFLRQ